MNETEWSELKDRMVDHLLKKWKRDEELTKRIYAVLYLSPILIGIVAYFIMRCIR
jgi:hypothetical protein